MDSQATQQLLNLLERLKQETVQNGKQTALIDQNVYRALLELLPQIAIETVIARRQPTPSPQGSIEVYLTKRPPDAPTHKNMWHTPGSFLRHGDTIEDVMHRISHDDLRTAAITHWQFVDIQNNHLEPNRHHICPIYLVQTEGELTTGQWFNLNDLPEPIVAHHRDGLLQRAVQPLLTEPYFGQHPESDQ